MKDNYVLSGLWLVATIGGIGYAGWAGTQHAAERAEAEQRAAAQARMQEAIVAGRSGRFAEAARILEALQAEHPRATSIALNLGIAYSGLELYDQAEAQFARVLEQDPEDWDAVAERATILVVKGDETAGLDLLSTVPAGEGRVKERLQGHPVWMEVEDWSRVQDLRVKHGVPARRDTAVRRLEEMERRRRDFEAANAPKQAPAE